MATTESGFENPTDDVPSSWTKTDDMRWDRDDGAVVRIRSTIPVRSASECNEATHSDAAERFEVLFHERPLPSTPEDIARVGTATAARSAARTAMEDRR